MAGSKFLLPGNCKISRTKSSTRNRVPACAGLRRSRTWTNPTTSSTPSPNTGDRECGSSKMSVKALATKVSANKKLTSVRGTITSRRRVSPAVKTSLTILRSSRDRPVCVKSMPCNSSSVMAALFSSGFPPSARTTRLVRIESNQIRGRKMEAMRSIVGAEARDKASDLCKAKRLGTSSLITREIKAITKVTPIRESAFAQL